MHQNVRSWTEAAAFCPTTVSINLSTWLVSLQQLSKIRETVLSPLKLTEHPAWCQQMADRRRNLPSQLPVHQPVSVPLLIPSGHYESPLPPPSQLYNQLLEPRRFTAAFNAWCWFYYDIFLTDNGLKRQGKYGSRGIKVSSTEEHECVEEISQQSIQWFSRYFNKNNKKHILVLLLEGKSGDC